MPKSCRYRHSGLTVASDIPLPEWEGFARHETSPADVRIRLLRGTASPFATDGEVTGNREMMRFSIPGIGAWEIVQGREITVFPHAEATDAELRLFTLGSAWAALGYQRGNAIWHGSAVAKNDRAILICGSAGAGKSTLAAALADRGCTLVADDLSRVEMREGGPVIHRSANQLKLWNDALTHLEWTDRITARDWLREDKYRCAPPSKADGPAEIPLAAIVVLDTKAETELQQLRGAEALTASMQATLYRPMFLDRLSAWPEQGALAAKAVTDIPVYRLSRPRDLNALTKGANLLLDLLQRLERRKEISHTVEI